MTGARRWADAVGDDDASRGRNYAARFAKLAARGTDIHGEATLCATLVQPGARMLDAGCGTGRVAIRLAELGYDCVGVDNDASMLTVARDASTAVTWCERDLADLGPGSDLRGDHDLSEPRDLGGPFDLVVAAGNVIPLLAAGTEPQVINGLAEQLTADGLLVTGFGLDAAHLPLDDAPFDLEEYDGWCRAASLEIVNRFATWSGEPYVVGGGYAVTISRRSR